MRFEILVSSFRERDVAFKLADDTGLDPDTVFEHLRGFIRSGVELTLDELRSDPDEQRKFVEFVEHVERCVQSQTAPVEGAVGT